MSLNVRRLVVGGGVAAALTLAMPMAAWADDYPPSTPSPTVTTIKPTPTPTVQAVKVQVASTPALPRTGTDAAVWGLSGVALVIGGSALVVASRRKAGGHS